MLSNGHKIMKQFGGVILNVKDKRQVSTVKLFRMLGWLPIDVRIHYFTAVPMFTIMNGQVPVYLVNKFTQNNSVHDHNTRSGTNIWVQKYNLSVDQQTFAYGGATPRLQPFPRNQNAGNFFSALIIYNEMNMSRQ